MKNSTFNLRLARIIFDECHCLFDWATFRPQYGEFDSLFASLPRHVRLLFASATVTDTMREQLLLHFQLNPSETRLIQLRNETPNVFIQVHRMPGAKDYYNVMANLLPDNPESLPLNAAAPPKFLVFMPTKQECENASIYLRSRLPAIHQGKIVWFHADMTDEFRAGVVGALRSNSGAIWGVFASESAAMVRWKRLATRFPTE